MVLADFANRTSDSTLGPSITEALRIDLSRSSVVRLLEGEEVRSALQRMERSPETVLTQAVAVEVAQREGATAVVAGEIGPLGAGYVLTASIMAVEDKSTLIAERETATDAKGLISAVDKLSRKLRERIGESLRTIRASCEQERPRRSGPSTLHPGGACGGPHRLRGSASRSAALASI
jgi:hypothetical protein